MSRVLVVIALLAVLTGCGPAAGTGGAPRPSIVLITLDTTRADHLGCYGYFRDTTPWLDGFAGRSILFERCVAPMAVTLPTHTSLLTATWPLEHGVLSNLHRGGATGELRSFAEVCRAAGYATGAFVSSASLARGTGIEAGFETFRQPEHGPQRPAGETNAEVVEWLDGLEGGPFFLWVHYFDPHWPFEPPPGYAGLFAADAELEAWLAARAVPARAPRPLAEADDEARDVHDRYDAELRYLDDRLAELFARLERTPGWERAAVLVVGDHGEGLCQHGVASHGTVWGEQTHVPLILSVPGERARRVPDVVSAVDALPTLLGRIDAPDLAGFLQQASGRDALAEPREPRPALSQDSASWADPDPGRYRFALTTSRWKLVSSEPFAAAEPEAMAAGDDGERLRQLEALGYAGVAGERPAPAGPVEYRLYDLAADPFELRDVAADHPDVVRRLARKLADAIRSQESR